MKIDARGKQCPLPVIETKKALEQAESSEVIEVTVDNEIAVQNLKKLADHKGLKSSFEKISDREFVVKVTASEKSGEARKSSDANAEEAVDCFVDDRKKGTVAVISSQFMGNGDDALGKLLMKGFVYALTQQDNLPETVLLYNGGAYLSCEGSDSLEDLKCLEAQGVEILTCGTCLNHYKLSEKLFVGTVTNMYEIVERMSGAKVIIRP